MMNLHARLQSHIQPSIEFVHVRAVEADLRQSVERWPEKPALGKRCLVA